MRRYEKGRIVGEPQAPKNRVEVVRWIDEEIELARERAERSEPPHSDREYLRGRQVALSSVRMMLTGQIRVEDIELADHLKL